MVSVSISSPTLPPTPAPAPSVAQVLVKHFKVCASILALLASSPTLNSLQLPGFPPTATQSAYNPGVLTILSCCPLTFSPHSILKLSLSHQCHCFPFCAPSPSPAAPALTVSSLLCSLSALDPSRCLWIFSLSYSQEKTFPLAWSG